MSPAGREDKAFYEAYVEEHVPYHRSPRGWKRRLLSFLPYWSYREWRFWDRWVPEGARLLDLGCARGREVFRQKAAWTAGVDLASNALRDCSLNYEAAVEARLASLPFADESFDCVVSSHVFGHVPPQEKDLVLGEIHRVLRAGGAALHVIETDSLAPLIQLAKQDERLYRERLIDQDGHLGLETPSRVAERFARAGFDAEAILSLADDDLHPRLAVKWFSGGYEEKFDQFRGLVSRSRAILESPIRLAVEELRLGSRRMPALGEKGFDEALFIAAAFRKSDVLG